MTFAYRADQAFRTVSYQVHSAGHFKTFEYQFSVCRVLVLHQGSLDGFLVRILRHVYFLTCERMNSCIVHTGRKSRWRRIEILYLFRGKAKVADIFRQFYSFFHGAARMGRHEIWYCILLLSCFFIGCIIFFKELLINAVTWFSHVFEYLI